ncbi:uncharacterized protein K452DRAFT_359242, partial [Aplosporella prunicola CBS 121167]
MPPEARQLRAQRASAGPRSPCRPRIAARCAMLQYARSFCRVAKRGERKRGDQVRA